MKTKTIIKIVAFLLSLLLYFANSQAANAKQVIRNVQGREVVVHSSAIPVILHRIVPPQYGRHVTQREVDQGRIPQLGQKNQAKFKKRS